MKNKTPPYQPILGFEDLDEYVLPQKDKKQLANIQQYLHICEQMRLQGIYEFMPNELAKVKELSAKYQDALRDYPKPKL